LDWRLDSNLGAHEHEFGVVDDGRERAVVVEEDDNTLVGCGRCHNAIEAPQSTRALNLKKKKKTKITHRVIV
jgi:hypothetical protein